MHTEEKAVRDEKMFNFRPAFFLAIFLCVGIFFSYICLINGVSAWWLVLFLPLVGALIFLYARKILQKRVLIAILSLVLAFGVGFISFLVECLSYRSQTTINGENVVLGTVVEKTEYDDYAVCILDRIILQETKVEGKLIAYLPATFCENVRLGDRVILQGNVRNIGENASVYQMQNDVRYLASANKFAVSGHTFHLFLFLRERIQTVVRTGMDETSAGVTLAVLLGDTSGIETGLLENVRYGGVAHIFAVSGLHIGALFGVCLMLFQKTKLKIMPKLFRFMGVAVIVFFYGGICGYTPSVVRALVMCLTTYATKLLGIGHDQTETIGFAAIVTLLLSPVSLFAVGFQLSFAACLGIVWFSSRMQRAIERKLGFEKQKSERHPFTVKQRIVSACVGIVCVTCGATVATVPILLNAFGYLSGWSLLLNFIFTPIVSMSFSILLLFVGIACVFPTAFSPFVLYLPHVFWSIALLIFQLCDFSSFAVSGIVLPWIGVVAYYGGLIFLTDKWNLPRKYTYLLSGVCFFAFLLVTVLSSM